MVVACARVGRSSHPDTAALVEAGGVGSTARARGWGQFLKIDDVLTIRLDRGVRVLKVTGFAEREGNAPAARALYDDVWEALGGS